MHFTQGAQLKWEGGKISVDRATFGNPSATVHYDAVDVKAGTGRMIGNAGSTDLVVVSTSAGITLIEQTGSGNLVFTTVFRTRQKGTSEYAAVMSRHIDTPPGPFPSQYSGSCVLW